MKTVCVIMILILGTNIYGQKNMLFLELGGNAQGSSLNYERQLTSEKGLMLTIGVGLALVKADDEYEHVFSGLVTEPKFSIPVSITYLFKIKNENYIETGLGYTWINIDKNYVSTERGTHNFILALGFRSYFGKQKSWMWKANFSPILAGNGDSGLEFGFSPMFGIALGKRF
ncbi:hypothetical protein [Maribacter sp. 2308TA10-17]|uniref:hypothetical protein n=1 Tax=Maribacter sp. 2308TA10-17 TaxID=3386276 RepID=UPI0039BC836B